MFANPAAASIPANIKAEADACGDAVLRAIEKNSYSKIDAKKCPTASKFLAWHRFKKGEGTFDEISGFVSVHGTWPAKNTLIANAELALEEDVNSNQRHQLIAWFTKNPPQTVRGVIHFTQHLLDAGKKKEAMQQLAKAWRTLELTSESQKKILDCFPQLLTAQDHFDRCEFLFAKGKHDLAKGIFSNLNTQQQKLFNARLAIAQRQQDIDAIISGLPQKLRTQPGLLYDRIKWHREKKDFEVATAFLQSFPRHVPEIYAEKLAFERNYITRELILMGRYREAYHLIEKHGLSEGENYCHAEWLAGWLALRFLKQADVAYWHFEQLFKVVKTPISKARAAYWAAEAKKALSLPGEMKTWYTRAAEFPHTYYGQVALGRLKKGAKGAFSLKESPTPSGEFLKRSEVQVIQLLIALKKSKLMDPFLFSLGERLKDKGEKLMLIELAHQHRNAHVALRLATFVGREPLPLVHAFYPVLKHKAHNPLAHAVIRQESRFDPEAVSSAGAVGLMQMMPHTAKSLQKKYRLKSGALTDVHYNTMLGELHLKEVLERYNGHLVLALAAYNAGPVVDKWVAEIGDPRDPSVDAIDWVEMIPYAETRNYVQRVLEGYVVYRARLNAPPVDVLSLISGKTPVN